MARNENCGHKHLGMSDSSIMSLTSLTKAHNVLCSETLIKSELSLVNTRKDRVWNTLRPIVPLLSELIPKRYVLLRRPSQCEKDD